MDADNSKKPATKISNDTITKKQSRISDWLKDVQKTTGIEFKNRAAGTMFLLIDKSGSMSYGGKMNSAKRGARNSFKEFGAKGFNIALISFDSWAHLLISPERPGSFDILNKIEPGGGTDIAVALKKIYDNVPSFNDHNVVVLVTDGFTIDPKAALVEADKLKDKRVEIITIGTEDADHELLSQIASALDYHKNISSKEIERAISEAHLLIGMNEK